jgi:hypothetical protein
MTIAIDATTGRPRALVVNDDGELLVAGAGGGGGGGDASLDEQETQTAVLIEIEAGVDGLETNTASTNTKLDTVIGHVDGIEGHVDGIEALLTTIDGRVDGVETTLSAIDTKLAQLGKSGGREYETVAAGQTTQTLGATGATGDYLECLVCVVATAATSQVQIKDGSDTAITVLPNAVGPGVGTYHVALGLTSRTGAWQITTAAGVSVIATGDFT